MKNHYMKIITLVILTALLSILTIALTVATIQQRQDTEFSGTFVILK